MSSKQHYGSLHPRKSFNKYIPVLCLLALLFIPACLQSPSPNIATEQTLGPVRTYGIEIDPTTQSVLNVYALDQAATELAPQRALTLEDVSFSFSDVSFTPTGPSTGSFTVNFNFTNNKLNHAYTSFKIKQNKNAGRSAKDALTVKYSSATSGQQDISNAFFTVPAGDFVSGNLASNNASNSDTIQLPLEATYDASPISLYIDVEAFLACNADTIQTQAQLEAEIVDFNTNSGAGDTKIIRICKTITLTSALSTIDNSTTAQLTIMGGTIDGANSFRVLRIDNGNVTLDKMTIQNGNSLTGGGILNFGKLTVTNSTLTGNNNPATQAKQGGGAIFAGRGGFVSLINSTISGNNAPNSWGGGILSNTSGWSIINSTITNNVANRNANLYHDGNSSFTIQNSIISAGCSIGSTALTVTNSFVLGRSCRAGTNNISSGNPRLGPLANNGGPTQTHALLSGSPVIDKGSNALIPVGVTTDQRGLGFSRNVGLSVDMGAFETQ